MKKSQVVSLLEENGLAYELLPIAPGCELLIMERGGRIFGPFYGEQGEGLFWMPEFWGSREAFREFLQSGNWNVGGDRIWIAPEIQFSVGDRTRFWETLQTPPAVDPGDYRIAKRDGGVMLRQSMALSAGVIARGAINLRLERTVRPATNPLDRVDASLTRDVAYCGFTHTLRLEGIGDAGVAAACWDLLQVVPKGKIYLPMYTPEAGVNYYEPIGALETLVPQGVIDRATGAQRYKVGYKAASVTGRFGYAGTFAGQSFLLVRNYPNDPCNRYDEEPPAMPGENGFSFHIYNDDGASGGFTEIECNLLSVGAPAGHDVALDRISTWIYTGNEAQLRRIGKRLLGFDEIDFCREEA